MARIRMETDARRAQLLAAAYKICKSKGIRAVTRAAVARECQVTDGLINRYFDGREGMRLAVMEHAVSEKDVKTLAACGTVYELPAMPKQLASAVRSYA